MIGRLVIDGVRRSMEAHNKLGAGHREEVYQQAMLKKLPEAG
ncbi:MAG: hypothetical protein HY675_03250 [Chloroflexi bacterium]|nr:hypothetical protein [Chloroflexota bacterium]